MRGTERQRGFTFLELLVVGAVIIGMVLFMLTQVTAKNVNPALHDADRRTQLAILMQKIVAYDTKYGHLPPTIPDNEMIIGTIEDGTNLCKDLVPEFMNDMVFDPTDGAKDADERCDATGLIYTTGYTIKKSKDNIVTISAPTAEMEDDMHISRHFKQ